MGKIGRIGVKRHGGSLPAKLSRPSRRALLLFALAVLAVAASLALTGCKYSSVLTDHMEDPNLGTLDEGADPIYRSNPDAELVLDLANISLDDVDDLDTQAAVLPHYDPDAPDNGPTTQRKKSDETPHDEEASEGEESDEAADRDGEGTDDSAEESRMPKEKQKEEEDNDKSGGDEDDDDDEDDDSGGDKDDDDDDENDGNKNNQDKKDDEKDNEENDDPLEDDDSDEPTESEEGSNSGDTVVVDPDDGTNDDTAKGTVAAVGEYATIAQMLGGAGALAACDETWLKARETDGCFAGELERVETAFDGDGTKDGSCDVDALVDTIQPSVVLWDSTANEPNLTESERTQLEDAGIKIQQVPHIGEEYTEDNDVQLAVGEVASVLEGASGLAYTPADVYAEYNAFHDKVLTACYKANGGFSYKYCGATTLNQLYQETPLAGLTDSVTTRRIVVYVDSMISGKSSIEVDRHTTGMVSESVKVDASDGVGISASAKKKYLVLDYYLQLAGVVNNSYDTAMPDSKGRSSLIMEGQVSSGNSLTGSRDSYALRSSDTGSPLSYWTVDADDDANWKTIGDADFNTVLVANSEIQDAIVASAKKSDGLYHAKSPYNVVVVPSGISGSWTAGHLDSFLLTPWAFRVQEEKNLEAADDYVENFYKVYLRCASWSDVVKDWNSTATAK